MWKRLRRLHISLAGKCQLLFGAAVVLIIAAALAVPWHRFEELTNQLDDGPAEMLARNALSEHVYWQRARQKADHPTSRPSEAAEYQQLSTASSDQMTVTDDDPAVARLPRLIGTDPGPERTDLTLFERKALMHFAHHPDSLMYTADYRRTDGKWGFRYARPVFLRHESCQECHVVTQQGGLTKSGLQPFGIVAVDIPSRIDSNQLLRNRLFILTAGFLAGTLAIIVFYLITTRLILQPVRVLQETAEKVSQGDLNIRSDINTGDEFQQLSETFNTMLANLKLGADQLVHQQEPGPEARATCRDERGALRIEPAEK